MRRLTWALLLGALAASPASAQHIEVEPDSASLLVGDSVQFEAAYFNQRLVYLPRRMQWSTQDPSVASVSEGGLVVGLSGGVTYVIARRGNVRDSAVVVVVDTVTPPPPPPPPPPVDSVPAITFIGEDTTGAGSTFVVQFDGVMDVHEVRIAGLPEPSVANPDFLGGTQEPPLFELPERTSARTLPGGRQFTFRADAGATLNVKVWGVPGYIGPADTSFTVAQEDTTAPPPPPPPPPPPAGAAVTVDLTTSYQTMRAWGATSEAIHEDPDYPLWRDELLDRAVNEVGLSLVTVGVQAGIENDVDHYSLWASRGYPQPRGGTFASPQDSVWYHEWRCNRNVTVNDNADPGTVNAAGFQWSRVDSALVDVVHPLRALDPTIEVGLIYVTGGTPCGGTYVHADPDEYAEFILAAVAHVEAAGVPVAQVEIENEPNNGPNGPHPGRFGDFIARAHARLNAAGYSPRILAPSGAFVGWTNSFVDAIETARPGVIGADVDVLMTHTYDRPDSMAMASWAARAPALGVPETGMSEFTASTEADLYRDLTAGGVSYWQLFGLAWYADAGNPQGSRGAWFHVDTIPATPQVLLTSGARLSQYTRYVRPGDVRVGATDTLPGLAVTAFNGPGGVKVVVNASGATSFGVAGLPDGTYEWSHTTNQGTQVIGGSGAVASGSVLTVSIPASGVLTVYPAGASPPPPPPPPDTTTGVAELPRDTVPTGYVQPTGATIRLAPGDDLQAALDGAQRGDLVLLEPGAIFTGEYTLRAKPGNGWVTIATDVALPPEGTRMTPSRANALNLARIQSGQGYLPALTTAPGASHYRVMGVEITFRDQPLQYGSGGIVRLGNGRHAAAEVPSWIVLDRVYVHGYPHHVTKRCVELNTAWSAVVDSYLDDCHSNLQDSQAIMGWNGPGPFKITNNYLAGGAENVMFGGGDPSIPGLVPSDITIRGNHFHRPSSWQTRATVMVKNLFELKNARRVLVEGNVFEGNWTGGQTGYALNIKSANQSGACTWCVTEHVTIRYNEIRNSTNGITVLGTSAPPPDVRLNHLVIEHNLLHDLGVASDFGGWGVGIQTVSGPSDVVIRRNTVVSGRQPLIFASGVNAGFAFTDNVAPRGQYGVKGNGTPEGVQSFAQYAPGGTVAGNVIWGANCGVYPSGTECPALAGVGFIDFAGGDYRITGQYQGKGADLIRLRALTQGVR